MVAAHSSFCRTRLTRWALWAALAAAPATLAGEAGADEGSPPPSAPAAAAPAPEPASAPGQPPAAATDEYPAEGEEGDGEQAAGSGASTVVGIVGICLGVAGAAVGAGLLAAGSDKKGEAGDISAIIQSEMPGTNPCGGPEPHARCDDLHSAADEGVVLSTAGYLLFAGGVALAVSGGLYLGVVSGPAPRSTSIRVAPALGPDLWGGAIGGTF